MGVVIYHMLTGKMPFDATSIKDLLDTIKKGEFEMPETFSDELKDLISQMLTKDQDSRITASEVLKHSWITNH